MFDRNHIINVVDTLMFEEGIRHILVTDGRVIENGISQNAVALVNSILPWLIHRFGEGRIDLNNVAALLDGKPSRRRRRR